MGSWFDLSSFDLSSFNPGGEFGLDELLYSLPAGQAPPEFSIFSLQANADVEEWTAGAFKGSEFGQGLVVRGGGRELELKTVGQFLDAEDG